MNFEIFFSDKSILITFISSFLIWFMFGGLVILWIIDGRVKKEEVLHAIFSIVLSWVFAEMIKTLFPIERPYQINGNTPLTITIPQSSSFPSSHAAVAFALAYSLYLHDRKIGKKFMILAVLVAAGRVLSMVHTFLDVLAGSFVGFAGAYLLGRLHFFRLLKNNKH